MTKVGGIRKLMVLLQAVFLAASPLVMAPPSNLTRLYYNGSAVKSYSTILQRLRRQISLDYIPTAPPPNLTRLYYNGFAAKSHSTILQRLRRQISLDYITTAPPPNLTRLYYNGSANKSHSTTTQYRQLRRLHSSRPLMQIEIFLY